MFAGFASNLLFGLCFSICGAGLIALIGLLANFPRILIGLLQLMRLLLRASYRLYGGLFTRLQPLILSNLGIDLLSPRPRTVASTVLSLALGCGLLIWLGWHIGWWWLAAFVLHGLVVGAAWEQIARPDEFRLGVSLQ